MSNSITKTPSATPASPPVGNVSAFIKTITKSKMFDQLCLLVLDGSASMGAQLSDGQTKAIATARGARELVERLKKSTKSSGFHVAIICYSSTIQVRLHPQPIDSLDFTGINFDPMASLGDGTMIGMALSEAEKMGIAFLNSGSANSKLKRGVRIVLMSDGYANDPEDTVETANRIKQKHAETMRLCTSFLANERDEDGWEHAEALMKSLASVDRSGIPYFKKTSSGAELRNFFEKSSTEE